MGKPGGFFKKLKSKQRRVADSQRRGTRGASKEERRQKHNEKVEFFSAKREADALAAISSSSSDDERDGDQDEAQRRGEQKLQQLRALLGLEKRAQAEANKVHRRGTAPRSGHDAADEASDEAPGDAHSGEDDEDDEWQAALRAGEEEEDEDEEDDEQDDDDDKASDDGLLVDDDDDDEEAREVNPFFEWSEAGDGDGDDEVIDPEEFEEEEDVEEDDNAAEDGGEAARESLYADSSDGGGASDAEDDGGGVEARPATDAAGRAGGKPAGPAGPDHEKRALLPRFELGTSSSATLRLSGVATEGDPWLAKYHLDTHGDVEQAPLQPLAISSATTAALQQSNARLVAQAAEAEAAAKTTEGSRDVMRVSAAEYAAVHPENITVAATPHARSHLLHRPFDLTAVAAAARTSSWDVAAATKPAYVHDALWERWCAFRTAAHKPVLTVEERGLLDLLQGYPDVMDCLRCWQNAESRRELHLLHLLNHFFKARSVVLAHDAIIAAQRRRRRAAAEAAESRAPRGKRKRGRDAASAPPAAEQDVLEGDDDNYEYRDRGFGKTRLMLVLPMRNSALDYVMTLVRVLGADPAACPKLSLFEQDFSEVEEAIDRSFTRRPIDYQRQFRGNIDDAFCVGLRLEPSRVHLYAHPLNSDLIICTPLGLRRRLERNGDVAVSLASVEVCVLDEAHVLLEQNWQQAAALLELLNKRPTDTTYGLSDLRRVYAWALEGKSGRHRQTILSTNISHAALLGSFRSTVNNSGKVLLQHRVEEGVLARVTVPVRQHFLRFTPESLACVDDDRFRFFTEQVFPTRLHPLAERGVRTIVLVPSYFDFVRLRNHLHREYRESFVAISEYTSTKQQRRALGQFSDLESPILLLTERFYFFKRYFVKLAEVIVFYSPPLFADFYVGLVNRLVATSPNAFAMTVFCRYDTHELNRIVGTERLRQLLERESDVFSFMTT